ncbi:tyrosine-protein phosphatase [Microbacterium indicum]|uniref:tyrosine-protein phosphatase n=1 Tax=Microbacterium indicum TaxID=358100 RepID=UPI0004191BBC|nr:tyrosine-protein phosphatase [Microbacterium indicum]
MSALEASPGTTAPPTGDHLGVDVPGVRNARGVGGLRTTDGSVLRDGVLLRTAGLHALDEPGIAALRAYGVRTVIDLRGRTEATQFPDADFGARLMHLPLHEPDAEGADRAERSLRGAVAHPGLPEVYREIWQTRGEDLVAGMREILATDDGAVLVHCTAGKDRTGVFVALLLAAVDVVDDDIVRTYAESAERLGRGFVDDITALMGIPAIPDEWTGAMLESPAPYIEEVLADVRREFGGAAEYLVAHGLTQDELTALRARFA